MKKTTLILTITATIIFSSSSIVSGASTQDTMNLYNSVAPISSEKSCQAKYYESLKKIPLKIGIARDTACEVVPSFTFLNGLTYRIVKSPDTGRYWLDRNLGATRACVDADGNGIAGAGDEACYGNLYQWGRNDDGHEDRTNASTSTTLATDITDAGTTKFIANTTRPHDWTTRDSTGTSRAAAWKDGGSNDICPTGFSVPTDIELIADTIHNNTYPGSNDITDAASAFSSFLKLPLAGGRKYNFGGPISGEGSNSGIWSRTTFSVDSRFIALQSGSAGIAALSRGLGLSVRCILDE